jgi:hypothetical protein
MLATFLAVVATAALWAWAVAHQLLIAYVVAVLIERLPPPDDKSGKFYSYVYSVLQVFAANSRRAQDAIAVAAKKPEIAA